MSRRSRPHIQSRIASNARRLHVEALEDRRMLATFTVTNTNDSGPGSFRNAVSQANATIEFDTVNFDSAIAGSTITLLSEVVTSERMAIDGEDNDITLSGGDATRIITANEFLSVENITLVDGLAPVPSLGGAIRAFDGLRIDNSSFFSNSARFGGAIYTSGSTFVYQSQFGFNYADVNGGAIYSDARLIADPLGISESEFVNNTAFLDGGAVYTPRADVFRSFFVGNDAGRDGGGAAVAYDLEVLSSYFADNASSADGGALAFGKSEFSGNITDPIRILRIVDSTYEANSASDEGGAIYIDRDEQILSDEIVNVNVEQTTITNNQAVTRGGGIFIVGSSPSSNFLEIAESTIAANTASAGGGVYVIDGEPFDIENSIIATNVATGFPEVDFRGFASFSHTLIGDNRGANINESQSPDPNGNLVGGPGVRLIDPLLDAVAFNGGPTPTRLLLPGSPAINAGDPDFYFFNHTDQRDEKRVRYQRVDMGAVEYFEYGPRELVVDSTADGFDFDFGTGELSLREAVLLAGERPGHPTITFDASLHGQTIQLDEGPITIATDVTIEGPGKDLLDISGEFGPGIFVIDDGRLSTNRDVIISGLTLRHVAEPTSGLIISAESTILLDIEIRVNERIAIHATDGALRFERSTIDASHGILAESGVPVEIVDSTFTSISETINNYVIEADLLTVINSTIDSSSFSGSRAAGIRAHGPTVVRHSTIVGNGGAANAGGGGIHFSDTLTLDHSIVAGNEGTNGPDLFADGPNALLESDFSLIGSQTGTDLQQTRGTPDARGNLVGGVVPPGFLYVTVDMAAMGAFELDSSPGPYSNDFFNFEYRIDGGPWEQLFGMDGGIAVPREYLMADNSVVTLGDEGEMTGPLFAEGTALSNEFQPIATLIPGASESLEFRFSADTVSEGPDDAFAFRNFRVLDGGPGGNEIAAFVTNGADQGGTLLGDVLPSDGFAMFGVDTYGTHLPEAMRDDSLTTFDQQGIIRDDDTAPFFGAIGVIGFSRTFSVDFSDYEFLDPQLGPLADNGGPTRTRLPLAGSPVINLGSTSLDPNLESALTVSVDVAAMGDFESSNDVFMFEYSSDGAAWQSLITATVEESLTQDYLLEGGATTTLNDPLSINGTLLDNNFQTFMATISDPGQEVSIRFRSQADSNEAFVWRNLVVERQSDSEIIGRAVGADDFVAFSSDSDYTVGGSMFGIRSRLEPGVPGVPFAVLDDSLSIFFGDTAGIIKESDNSPFFAATNINDVGGNTATWSFSNAVRFDQRGVGNSRLEGSRIDAGAVETFTTSATLSEAVAQTLGLSPSEVEDLDTGLLLWLDGNDEATFDASGDNTQWLDKSGNNSSAIQADATAAPVRSGPWIDFTPDADGAGSDSDDSLGLTLNSAPAGQWTGTVVFEVDGNSSDQGIVNPTPFTASGFSVTHHFNLVYSYYGNGSNHLNTTADVGQPHAAISAWTGGTNPEDGLLWSNGDQVLTGAGSPVAANDLSSQLVLGNAATPLDGRIGTVIIHSGVLSDTARQQLEGYLAAIWGTPLPAGHPFAQSANADFDGDNDIDGADFLAWQRGFGTASGALPEDGDANGDNAVDGVDLSHWQDQYGQSPALAAARADAPSVQEVSAIASPELVDAAVMLGQLELASSSREEAFTFRRPIFELALRSSYSDPQIARGSATPATENFAPSEFSAEETDEFWLSDELIEQVFALN